MHVTWSAMPCGTVGKVFRGSPVRTVLVFLLSLALGFAGLYLVAGAELFRTETYRIETPTPWLVFVCVAAFFAEWLMPGVRLAASLPGSGYKHLVPVGVAGTFDLRSRGGRYAGQRGRSPDRRRGAEQDRGPVRQEYRGNVAGLYPGPLLLCLGRPSQPRLPAHLRRRRTTGRHRSRRTGYGRPGARRGGRPRTVSTSRGRLPAGGLEVARRPAIRHPNARRCPRLLSKLQVLRKNPRTLAGSAQHRYRRCTGSPLSCCSGVFWSFTGWTSAWPLPWRC